MRDRLTLILFYVVVMIVQIIISDYVSFGPVIYICVLHLLVISLPPKLDHVYTVLISFGLGLLLDLLTDGVLGLNAGAATLTALAARPIYNLIFNKDTYDKEFLPTIRESGISRHIYLITFSVMIFFLFYIAFDGFSHRNLTFTLVRYLACCAINIGVIILIDVCLLNNKRRV